jgi:hypothetical protein
MASDRSLQVARATPFKGKKFICRWKHHSKIILLELMYGGIGVGI